MASAVVFESTAAQAVGPCSLLASVTAPGGRRFVHDNFAKAGTLRLQFLPEPFRHFFNRWVLQSFDVVEISVVQHFQERFHRVADIRMVIDPACFWVDIAFHRDFDLKTVSMHATAFMSLGCIGQSLRCFKREIFRQSCADQSNSALRRAPDELVHLTLKTNVQFVGQNPFHDFAWIDPAENR